MEVNKGSTVVLRFPGLISFVIFSPWVKCFCLFSDRWKVFLRMRMFLGSLIDLDMLLTILIQCHLIFSLDTNGKVKWPDICVSVFVHGEKTFYSNSCFCSLNISKSCHERVLSKFSRDQYLFGHRGKRHWTNYVCFDSFAIFCPQWKTFL